MQEKIIDLRGFVWTGKKKTLESLEP